MARTTGETLSMIIRHPACSAFALLRLAACARDAGGRRAAVRARPELRRKYAMPAGGCWPAPAPSRPAGVRVRVEAAGLAPGTYARARPRRSAAAIRPAFASAGPHWNPTGAPARPAQSAGPASRRPSQPEVGTDGAGTVEFTHSGGIAARRRPCADRRRRRGAGRPRQSGRLSHRPERQQRRADRLRRAELTSVARSARRPRVPARPCSLRARRCGASRARAPSRVKGGTT